MSIRSAFYLALCSVCVSFVLVVVGLFVLKDYDFAMAGLVLPIGSVCLIILVSWPAST